MAQCFGQVPTPIKPVAVPCNYQMLGFSPAIYNTDPATYAELAENLELASGGRIILGLEMVDKGLIAVIENVAVGETEVLLEDAVEAINQFILGQVH